jgi:DNA-directed RNA polymerase subunit N (RpoN/RPB10)|tara:strand:- start:420 stop:671 length:252 start_codon:yes stop_codon:yes gene_type:complete
MGKLVRKGRNLIDKPEEKMIIPIRCWSCGKPIGQLWESYLDKVNAGEERKKVLDGLKLERYCCRAMFLGHVDLIDTTAQFKKF